MLQSHAKDIRSRLRLTASALALATACAGMTVGANADTTLTASNSPLAIHTGTGANGAGDTSEVVTVTSGTTAELLQSGSSVATTGDLALTWNWPVLTTASSCTKYGTDGVNCYGNADVIKTEAGSTLIVSNPWSWMVLDSMFQVSGTVDFKPASGIGIIGDNSFLGDFIVEDGAGVQFGYTWGDASNITFGENTNIYMKGTSSIYLKLTSGFTSTMGGAISSTGSSASFELAQGTLVVNGKNTTSNAFYGTFNVDAGATLVVGDATHSSAVFGDPTGSTAVVNVNQSGGSLGILQGYGTIDATVNNNGIVKAGGTSGTFGTLTINGNYTQGSTGQLKVEISPTSNSSLIVNGKATLDGSLIVVVDSGNYGNAVYNVLSANSISGSAKLTLSGTTSGVLVGLETTSTGISLVTEKSSAAQSFGHIPSANRAAVTGFMHGLYDQIEAGLPSDGAQATGKDGDVRIWGHPYGRIDNVGNEGMGYNVTYAGLMTGVEYHFPVVNAVVGGAFSYTTGSMDVKGENSSVLSHNYSGAIYGGADLQYARIDGAVFYSMYDTNIKRHMGSYGTAHASPDGWSWGATVQVSHDLFNNLVTPYVRGVFSRDHLDGVTETGTEALALKYTKSDATNFVGDMGARVHVIAPTPELKIKLDLLAGIAHDFGSPKETVVGSFANLSGSTFTYKWQGNSANAIEVGTEFSDEVVDGLEIYARVNGQFTTKERAGDISIGGRYRF